MTDNHTEPNDPELALIDARRELETTRFVLADLLAAFSVTTANYTPEQQRTARQASLLLNPPKPKEKKP